MQNVVIRGLINSPEMKQPGFDPASKYRTPDKWLFHACATGRDLNKRGIKYISAPLRC